MHRMLAKLGKARFHWKYVRLPLELSCLLGMHRFLQFSWSLELFEASSGLWGFPTAALDSSLNAGEMNSREFEGIRGDSGERPGPMLHWAKQAQFRGKRPPKSACKRPPQGQKKPDFEGDGLQIFPRQLLRAQVAHHAWDWPQSRLLWIASIFKLLNSEVPAIMKSSKTTKTIEN